MIPKIMKQRADDRHLPMIQRDFGNHVARLETLVRTTGSIEILHWSKPGTCAGQMLFMCWHNSLVVRGDYGEAVFDVSEKQSLKFWGNTDLSYFRQKCSASEGGKNWQEWSQSKCDDSIDEHMKDLYTDEGVPIPMDEWDDSLTIADAAKNATSDEYEFHRWLHDNADKLLGEYWMDLNPYSWGHVPPFRMKTMLLGLQMALAQLEGE